jgi:hypothetical protein
VKSGNNQAGESEDPCSVGKSAVAGALVGALIGGLVKGRDGAIKGAVVGGTAGAIGCAAVNSNSRQTKSAAQVDQEYVKARGMLPSEPQLVSYNPKINSVVVQRGQPLKINSIVELVNGSTQPVRDVREELVIFDPQGEKVKNGTKSLQINSGGRFENSFEVTLPEGVSQGMYAMKTNLYVNGKLSATRNLQAQFVWQGEVGLMLAGK